MDPNLEEMKRKKDGMKFLIDLLAQTGKPKFVFQKKSVDFSEKITDLGVDEKITDDQYKKLSNLIDQFDRLVDDVLKEDN